MISFKARFILAISRECCCWVVWHVDTFPDTWAAEFPRGEGELCDFIYTINSVLKLDEIRRDDIWKEFWPGIGCQFLT